MFLITSFFITSLNLLKSVGVVFNSPISNLPALPFRLLKTHGSLFNLSISNLSTSYFKSAKSVFLAKSDVSTPAAFLNLLLLFNYANLI